MRRPYQIGDNVRCITEHETRYPTLGKRKATVVTLGNPLRIQLRNGTLIRVDPQHVELLD